MKNSSRIILLILLISALFIFIGFSLSTKIKKTDQKNIPETGNLKLVATMIPSPNLVKEKAKVTFVYDGDTIELTDKRKVRYIGINTPEINWAKGKPQCFATESAKINQEMVKGQEIEMAKDTSETDKYGRLLRFVWIDGIFVNDFLLRQGFAKLDIVPPDTNYSGQFKEAQKEARDNKRGLWGKCKD